MNANIEQFLLAAVASYERSLAEKGDLRGPYEHGRLTSREVHERRGAVEGFCRAADALGLTMTPAQFKLWLVESYRDTHDELGRPAPRKVRVEYLQRQLAELHS